VRLHPRRGTPDARDSSVGGPLWWPVHEAWPECAGGERHVTRRGKPTDAVAPLLPVVQLWARDVPELRFPDGCDLFQLLWCPMLHTPAWGPEPVLRWRDSRAGAWRAAAPPGGTALSVAIDDFVPAPCAVHPERVIDHPAWFEFDDEFRTRAERGALGAGMEQLLQQICAPGTKVGGWPHWMDDPEWPQCPAGHGMTHLLTLEGWEYDGASWEVWQPLSDRPDLHREDSGLNFGDAGGWYLFVCATCPDLPATAVLQG